MIDSLVEHLSRESELYKELIKTLQEETGFLVGRDYKGLSETAGKKEHLLLRIHAAGQKRSELIKDAARALGLESEEPTLSLIIKSAPGRTSGLAAIQSTVLSLVETVKEINSLNGLVIKGSLENVNKALGLLGGFATRGVYNPAGAFQAFQAKGTQLSEGA